MSSRPVARRPTPPPADEPPRSQPAAPTPPNSVTLGPRDRVIGQLYIEGDLVVGGVVEGEVEVTGDVEIGDMAKTKASLAGRDVSINGHHTGPVVARKRLVVGRSGSVFGDVRVARLVIQDGATFSGKVSMGAGAVEAPAPVKPPEALTVPEPAPAAEPQPEPKAEAPKAVAEKKPMPAVVAPVVARAVAARADGKDGGKAKTAPPPPQQKGGKAKRR